MDLTQVKRELANSRIHDHLCDAINHLTDAALLAEVSPDYSIEDIATLLDMVKAISAIGHDFPRINSKGNN
ncbi:hypothetical protein IQ230_13910 [Gloeocapsopsis crepidinum LEGE 06123]|uniref:Uncharacterized protein n=1 Tax=Gloeocapsopsis crepidinum LEGE 06123 TaxID=588587 RepID=A0ABR9UT07_9CHRO|nr:hypothetical protein [Gloeocapsopsis crepidinum]MBE9191422.1 hypothetical protein [Gloeocapsopsis crepidinum LEGE 06123]